MKTHMHQTGSIQYILGVNGFCFIKSTEAATPDLRKQMAYIRNSILALEQLTLPIFKDTIEMACK